MKVNCLLAPFKTISSIDVDDAVVVLRIICGGSIIAGMFQTQKHGWYVAILMCILIKVIRYYLCNKEELHD